MDGPGIDEVTTLVQELINRISSKREVAQNTRQLASLVLQRENEKLRILENYQHERDLLIQRGRSTIEYEESESDEYEPQPQLQLESEIRVNSSNVESLSTNTSSSSLPFSDPLEQPESESRQLLEENLELRIELQRLQEMETKSNELICGYELAMANIRTSVESYSRTYKPSINWIVESYKSRLSEEQQMYDDLKSSHDRLLFSLAALRDTLNKGRLGLSQAIDEYQSAVLSD